MIKSVKNNEEKKESFKGYPKLMEHGNGMIVFFIREKVGHVLLSEDPNFIEGYFSEGWQMIRFWDYKGRIEIENA
tara:strand:+ start:76604 stop:76828 length:225 start_codon:yes stop_codon:yes gene_type:complete